ncbi:DHH family phosphoesterase [Rugosimonospora africana]|uniref:Bifunctional oligoribonuclease and PAP phosphatase NrnA n=1 Tax=Rugosimonospora africana TaxID=556532 RepID=A0A8J3VPQ9_9ACTN|nr:DHH family phosphoesterase [Rugosimonospora africana]GIH13676.1 bifunctional oligoribonuclease and PAP phosphatase NrnA [Rugosimonospora africana]
MTAAAPAAPLRASTEDEWASAVAAIRGLPADGTILLVCHVNPDGDALGSMLGFGLGLRRLGRAPLATFPAPYELVPPFDELPGLDLLIDPADAPAAPDLLICFDAASVGRLGELADRLETAGTSVVLDHHASNSRFGDVPIVEPTAAATAVVAEALLTRLGVALDAQIAECLYVALSTDTGSFKFDLTTPSVHELAARLLATGIKPADISRRLFDSRPFGAMKLYGDVLARASLEPAAAGGAGMVWSYATLDDLERHGQRRHVLEGLIDAVRVAEEADVTCVLKQVGAQEWSVSLRSKGAVDVARVAVGLGGGGHRLAAGFTGYGSLTEVVDLVRAAL